VSTVVELVDLVVNHTSWCCSLCPYLRSASSANLFSNGGSSFERLTVYRNKLIITTDCTESVHRVRCSSKRVSVRESQENTQVNVIVCTRPTIHPHSHSTAHFKIISIVLDIPAHTENIDIRVTRQFCLFSFRLFQASSFDYHRFAAFCTCARPFVSRSSSKCFPFPFFANQSHPQKTTKISVRLPRQSTRREREKEERRRRREKVCLRKRHVPIVRRTAKQKESRQSQPRVRSSCRV
jgi:hypothetical protein